MSSQRNMWSIPTVFLAICLLMLARSSDASQGKTIFCYWDTSAHYRLWDGEFRVENIDPELCTHLAYSSFGITDLGEIESLDSALDITLKNIANAIKLKKSNSNLKVLASVGGWNECSSKYIAMAADAKKRAKFVSTTVAWLVKYGFDGVDLDWQYPAQRGVKPANKQNFVILLKELKAALKPKNKLLTVAVAAPKPTASLLYDIPGLSQYVDLINVMTYDFHSTFGTTVGHSAPLFDSGSLNVASAIDYWLSQGAPASKLLLGIPLYGRSFTLMMPDLTTVGSESEGPGTPGPFTSEAGLLSYNEICVNFDTWWTVEWDSSTLVPYAHNGNQWVSFENYESIVAKTTFINEKGLAGAMVRSIESDDFRANCGAQNSLLLTINENV